MKPWRIRSFTRRGLTTLAFVVSAAAVAAAIRLAATRPLLGVALLGAAASLGIARWVQQRRLRKLLRSGDVQSILERWSGALDHVPHAATMGPLMTATAFTAYGWVDEARVALAAAERGPAWEAALEHRLFLDTMLLAFEGEAAVALERARRLERLPMPASSGGLRRRVALLRVAAGALARAFAHESRRGDRELLERASHASPLVFWAMRYAAAVVAIDQGDDSSARDLIEGAPAWPAESTFRAFHHEIAERAMHSV